jgi:hypothetical protein
MLRLGFEELLENVLTAHYNWIRRSGEYESQLYSRESIDVDIDITNQPDADDEKEFNVGHYGPLNQNVRAKFVARSKNRGQIIATYSLEVLD